MLSPHLFSPLLFQHRMLRGLLAFPGTLIIAARPVLISILLPLQFTIMAPFPSVEHLLQHSSALDTPFCVFYHYWQHFSCITLFQRQTLPAGT